MAVIMTGRVLFKTPLWMLFYDTVEHPVLGVVNIKSNFLLGFSALQDITFGRQLNSWVR